MKSRALIYVLGCLLLLCRPMSAQESMRRQLVVPLGEAGFVAFKIETVSSDSRLLPSGLPEIETSVNPRATVAAGNVIHRTLVDNFGNFIFGYDLLVEPVAGSKRFKISVRPLSAEYEKQLRRAPVAVTSKRGAQGSLSVSTLPRPAEAQIIEDGDGFALDLLVNSQTGVRIVDVVKVSFDRTKLWEVQMDSPARDFTLDKVELSVRDYELLVDGEQLAGGKPTSGTTGALLWLYIPDRGRFIFSLIPRAGYDFQKVGVVEENKISFTFGGKKYEWISSAPIVGRGGNWNLWVLLDADYVPDFFPSARDTINRQRAEQKRFDIGALDPRTLGISSAMQVAERQATLAPKVGNSQNVKEETTTTQKRPRVIVGSADRIENLLPKN
ncbi:MAG TPA: hypothetical protein VGB73_19520 [Pyrinomonadaceae bacterium]|jgi:hypothetical protein